MVAKTLTGSLNNFMGPVQGSWKAQNMETLTAVPILEASFQIKWVGHGPEHPFLVLVYKYPGRTSLLGWEQAHRDQKEHHRSRRKN